MKQSWSYDWLGNTTASTDDANLFYDRSLGAIGNDGYRLTSATRSTDGLTASYDAAGYMKTMSITRAGVVPQQYDYEWDEVGRLTKATRYDGAALGAELTFAYDASDQRVRKSAGSRHSIYVFGSLELRSTDFTESGYTVDPSTEVPYLFGHGVRLARVTYIGATEFKDARRRIFLELGDHLGSTSVVMDRATGQLVERSTAYAYGAAESNYRPGEWYEFREDYRFTGKEDDIEVGLIYFGARYLNPQLGRWISADPLAVHAPGKADLNLYAYVHGRVLSAVDPVGLDDDDSQAVRFAVELAVDGVCDYLGCGDAHAAISGLDSRYNSERVGYGTTAIRVAAGVGLGIVFKEVAPRVFGSAVDMAMVSSFAKRIGKVASRELGRISKVIGMQAANRLGGFVASHLSIRSQLHRALQQLNKVADLPSATKQALTKAANVLDVNIKPEEIVGTVSQKLDGVGGHSAPRFTDGSLIDHAQELRNGFQTFHNAIDALSGPLKHLQNEAQIKGGWTESMTREKSLIEGTINTMRNMESNITSEIGAASKAAKPAGN